MVKKTLELQNNFLRYLLENQKNVHIYLVNGIKLHGKIESFDFEVIMLKGRTTQMVYKKAISTIVPFENNFH